jgi:nucleotide-binding universal stress UspA family protein
MTDSQSEQAMVRRILIAFDGSEPAKRAFRFGIEMARLYRARATVVSVAQLPEPATMVETTAIVEAATEHFGQAIDELLSSADAVGVDLDTRVLVGHVAEQLCHLADQEKADLIVMGHRGKSLIKRWLLGSVSKRVISYAPCSVLVVR